jgi:hypothetical protein
MNFKDYLILGDDVVIAHKRVSEEYYSILSDLGVEVSLRKSVVSSETHYSCEFASRHFLKGEEYSTLALGLVHNKTNLLQLFKF